jgi:TRAP-type mannitol/chloroaromatic compound transport system permease large subunit
MAMSCYYLKGIAPPEVKLTTIFKGSLPFLGMVLLSMVLVHTFPQITEWLPDLIYGIAK